MKSLALFLVLFNPFLMSIYLLDLIQDLDYRTFFRVLVRATLISASVFMLFAWGGEAIFTNLLQVRFAAFLVFGGIVISLIALQMMFTGSNAIRNMRGGDPEHISGSIAMSLALTVMMPMISQQLLPGVLVGLMLAGLFAATMSTADSLILSCSASLTRDLLHEHKSGYATTKLATAAVVLVALALSLSGDRSVSRWC